MGTRLLLVTATVAAPVGAGAGPRPTAIVRPEELRVRLPARLSPIWLLARLSRYDFWKPVAFSDEIGTCGNNTGIEGEGTLSLNSEAAADLAIADLTGLMTGGSGDLSEPLLTLVLWRAASNTSKLVPPAEGVAEAAAGAGGSGCLWSSFLAPGCWCWFFSSFEICSSASSWEDGERPRFCRSRGGGARGRSSDGGEIRADWGNGCGRLTFGCCCCKLSVGCCGRLIVGWWAKVTGSCCSPPIEEGCGRLLTTRCCCCCWGAKSAAGSCGRLMGGLCCCCCDRTTDWFRPVVAGDANCR